MIFQNFLSIRFSTVNAVLSDWSSLIRLRCNQPDLGESCTTSASIQPRAARPKLHENSIGASGTRLEEPDEEPEGGRREGSGRLGAGDARPEVGSNSDLDRIFV